MTALILAAGLGTRLFPFTAFCPKPLLPVGGRPLVEGLLRQLRSHGCREAVLAVSGREADLFEAALGDGGLFGLRLRYARSEAPLGKAGEIEKARPLLQGCGDFLCIHGDLLTNVDLGVLRERHARAGRLATVAASTRCVLPVGVVDAGPDGRVTRFTERPALGRPVSVGLYVFSDRIFQRLAALRPRSGPFELGEHVFPGLAAGGDLAAHVGDFPWIDVGSVEAYRQVFRGPSFDGRRWPLRALEG
jgi:NDP-sugar pyrophosphorylase family protein